MAGPPREGTMQNIVVSERHEAVAVVTLNRPERRNALDSSLVAALAETLRSLQADHHIRAVVLRGGEHFCAGGDLSSLGRPALEMRNAMTVGHEIVRLLIGGRLPTVAAVRGTAYGAGFSIAMACDFVVTDDQSVFCAAFGRVGLTPDYGLLWTLPQRVSLGVAREIVMLCEPISGTRARELGLADNLAKRGKVDEVSLQLATRLAGIAPATVATTRAVLARQPLTLDTVLAWEADTQTLLTGTGDFAEGLSAFREKRDPVFRGE
jgi:2-(1,2-epoxy-1,2-dihydrophenyl)acetyl-CoA isomerase